MPAWHNPKLTTLDVPKLFNELAQVAASQRLGDPIEVLEQYAKLCRMSRDDYTRLEAKLLEFWAKAHSNYIWPAPSAKSVADAVRRAQSLP